MSTERPANGKLVGGLWLPETEQHFVEMMLRKRDRLCDVRDLARLGEALMDTAETDPGLSPTPRALQYRDGLLIAFLAARPLRRRNVTGLPAGDDALSCDPGHDEYHAERRAARTGPEPDCCGDRTAPRSDRQAYRELP